MKAKPADFFFLAVFSAVILSACSPPSEVSGKAVRDQTAIDDDKLLAYKQGWHDCFNDSLTLDEYHRCADALDNDDDEAALARIWETAKEHARDRDEQWASIAKDEKLRYPMAPFWKKDKGQPRRFSRSQQRKFIEALTGKDNPPL